MCVCDINTHFQLLYTDKVDEKEASDDRTLGQWVENTVKKTTNCQQEIVKYPSSLTFPLEEMHWHGLQR